MADRFSHIPSLASSQILIGPVPNGAEFFWACARPAVRASMAAMSQLKTDLALTAPDDFYEALMDAHKGLSDEQSQALNARLVLILANQVGDQDVLVQAIAAAKKGL